MVVAKNKFRALLRETKKITYRLVEPLPHCIVHHTVSFPCLFCWGWAGNSFVPRQVFIAYNGRAWECGLSRNTTVILVVMLSVILHCRSHELIRESSKHYREIVEFLKVRYLCSKLNYFPTHSISGDHFEPLELLNVP